VVVCEKAPDVPRLRVLLAWPMPFLPPASLSFDCGGLEGKRAQASRGRSRATEGDLSCRVCVCVCVCGGGKKKEEGEMRVGQSGGKGKCPRMCALRILILAGACHGSHPNDGGGFGGIGLEDGGRSVVTGERGACRTEEGASAWPMWVGGTRVDCVVEATDRSMHRDGPKKAGWPDHVEPLTPFV
jgi:hypothetical protein